MKIGILTLPLNENYGGVLQAYALQQVLAGMGHEPVLLNRGSRYLRPRQLLLQCGSVVKCLLRKYVMGQKDIRISNPFSPDYTIYKSKCPDSKYLRLFIRRNIRRTCRLRSTWQLKTYVKLCGLRCFVVGSDQVWRKIYAPCLTDNFLCFLPDGKRYVRVAYAASFGTETFEATKEEAALCAGALKKFDAVSVRECGGVGIVKILCGIDAAVTLDPTLLLRAEDYMRLIEEKDKEVTPGVVSYILDADAGKSSVTDYVASTLRAPVTAMSLSPKDKHGNRERMISVSGWLSRISNADFVVTDSFHGCVFSIIFKKNFIAILNKERGADRFHSLLGALGLTDRLVTSLDDLKSKGHKWLNTPIDYGHVYGKYVGLKEESLEFLRNALNG